MSFLKRPFKLGSITLPNNIFYAPLAGCSDFPFRQMTSQYKPGLIYCEMVKMDALIRNDPGTYHILDYERSMHPIGGQICGSKPKIAGQAARIIEELGFDVVDLNCGCPVDKVTKDGSGSGMMKTPYLIGEIISNMVTAVKIPVTVKIRAGWDEKSINAPLITRIAEEAGAAAICIHGRTREQGYKGPANWDYIKACRAEAKNILIIGNGDLFDGPSALRMFEHTKCDAVLASRGTLGKPWIVEEIISSLSFEELRTYDIEEHRQALLNHFKYILQYHPEKKSAVDVRRVGCWYLKKSQGTRSFREMISRVDSTDKALKIIEEFPLGDLVLGDPAIEESACETC